ncbi:MAG: CvpA family protein [Candidatus Cloacimonetes bacterium]|nr:CvpA family protein [Candidatus Cloacimonadota bacterium]
MNIADIILGIFLLIFIIHGFVKGLIASLLHLVGLILAVVLIANTGTIVKESMMVKFGLSETLAVIFAYVLIFILIMLIFRIAIIIFHKVVNFLNLTALNRILGAVFGLLNGVLIIAILLVILDLSPLGKIINENTQNSKVITYTRVLTSKLQTNFPKVEEEKEKLEELIF